MAKITISSEVEDIKPIVIDTERYALYQRTRTVAQLTGQELEDDLRAAVAEIVLCERNATRA